MTITKSWFSYLTRAFALSLCTALLLNFVSCSDSSTSQDPKVKIILDANGGSFSETTDKTQTLLIKKNQAYKLPTADELGLSRDNHNFTGWAKSQQGQVEFDDGADITSSTDLTLYAQWEAVNSTYTVKHLLQNLADNEYTENEEATEQKTGTYGTQTAAAAKTYEGFTAKPIEQKTIQADGLTVVEIKYDRNTYTVSYSSTYGDTPQAKTVKYEYILTADDLPDVTQTNYSFKGWLLDGASIPEGYKVKTDINLTALWDEIIANYTVKHLLQNLQDDEYTEDSTEQKSGTYGTQTAAVAKTYEGFTAQPIEQKTIQADGQTVVEIKYDRNTYTVSYSSEYGDAPTSKTVKYEYVLTAADLPDLTQANYSFNGWLLDGASIAAGYTVKKAITLTALWDEIIANYTVKHLLQNLQDDSYTEDSTEQKSGNPGTQTVATAKSYEGFTVKTFAQKTIQADGTTVVEIYYDRKTYTVSYSSTYGYKPQAKTVKYGYVLTTDDLPFLSETGYYYNGWVYENTSIEAGYTVKTDITLTASWNAVIVVYTVRHLLQNLQDDNYTEDEEAEEQIPVAYGTLTLAVAKTYEGFTAKLSEEKPIWLGLDDSTVVEIYYDRNTYTVSYSSTYGEPPASKTVKYGYYLTAADLPVLPDTVLSFNGWRLDGASIEAGYTVKTDITITAQWKAPASVTMENLSAVIAALTEDSTIVVTGVFTESDLAAIATAIKNSRYKVNLDLSQATGITSIPDSTFSYCKKLSGITIPDFVTSIGKAAFFGCTSLTSITVDSNNANYSSIDGVLFNKDATAIITYPAGKQSDSYTIPDSVTSISDQAFLFCTSLASVTIGNSVTSIGDSAFYSCDSLSSVTIPDSVTSIRDAAFFMCTSLSSIIIPDSVTSIGYRAFYCCSKLTSISFIDPTTWYRTTSVNNWNNKTNGTLTDVSDAAANATNFQDTYKNYYWYKLDE